MPTRLSVDVVRRLDDFRLEVRFEAGTGVLVLFGPSGAGKTSTLNAVAGLLTPDEGEITFDGEVFFRRGRPGPARDVPPRRRRVGYVFQSYALFPHMTVLENVRYPLRGSGGERRARELLERVRIERLAERYPHEISGGQQQRVALARALAAGPQLLLLDEPFAALDAPVRELLQRDLAALQAELGLVVLYVTHRLDDAFALGQRLAVLREGRIEQVGTIEEVFRRPANEQVAGIMGIRNLFRARVWEASAEGVVLDWEGVRIEAPPQAAPVGECVSAYIAPEDIKILYPDRPVTGALRHNQLDATVAGSGVEAGHRTLRVRVANGGELELRFPLFSYSPLGLAAGERVRVSLRREGVVLLPPPGTGAATGSSRS